MKNCPTDVVIHNAGGDVLSIVIPTYNRAAELRESLGLILSQRADGLARKVDIIVCDNASTDGTERLCTPLALDGKISYYRHTKNIGPMPQLYVGPHRATAPFCWILADDDWLMPNTLPKIVATLEQGKADYLMLNYEQRNVDMTETLVPCMATDQDYHFNTFADFSRLFSVCQASFISCQIFRREPYVNVDETPYVKPAFGFQHYGALMEVFWHKPVQYLGTPMIINRAGNITDENTFHLRNWHHLSFPVMRAIQTAMDRLGLPAETWNQISGLIRVKSKDDWLCITDRIMHNVIKACIAGYTPDDADWANLQAISKGWRPAARILANELPSIIPTYLDILAKNQNDVDSTKRALQITQAGAQFEKIKTELLQRVRTREQTAATIRHHLMLLAQHLDRNELDQVIKLPPRTSAASAA